MSGKRELKNTPCAAAGASDPSREWQRIHAELVSAAWADDAGRIAELLGEWRGALREGPLEIAAERSGEAAIRALYPAAGEPSRSAALFRAVSSGRSGAAALLVELGARPEAGADLMLHAAGREELGCLRALLPIATDAQLDTAVFMTGYQNSPEGARLSLEEMARRGLEAQINGAALEARRSAWRQAPFIEAFALVRSESLALDREMGPGPAAQARPKGL